MKDSILDDPYLQVQNLTQQLADRKERGARNAEALDFLREKGITVGWMKEADKPERLMYVFRSGSELDETGTVNKLVETQIERDRFQRAVFELQELVSADEAKLIERSGRILDLERQLGVMRMERDHWKANHDHAVAVKRDLLDRPDLGDRCRRVLALRERITDLETVLAEVIRREREGYLSFCGLPKFRQRIVDVLKRKEGTL